MYALEQLDGHGQPLDRVSYGVHDPVVRCSGGGDWQPVPRYVN